MASTCVLPRNQIGTDITRAIFRFGLRAVQFKISVSDEIFPEAAPLCGRRLINAFQRVIIVGARDTTIRNRPDRQHLDVRAERECSGGDEVKTGTAGAKAA